MATRTNIGRPFKRLTLDRFMKSVYPEPNTGCWLWGAAVTRKGYGNATTSDGEGYSVRMAHRVSYFLHNGKFNYKLCICHTCDTPACVNPQHLFLGTILENTEDMRRKKRASRHEDHWKAKINFATAQEIRERYKTGGCTHRGLAKEYGLSSITAILSNKIWVEP